MLHTFLIAVVLLFLVNLLLLLGTNRICGMDSSLRRVVLGALIGSLGGGVLLKAVPQKGVQILLGWAFRGLTCAAAFGCSGYVIANWIAFWLLYSAVGGAAQSVEQGLWLPILIPAIEVWAVSILAARSRNAVPIEITEHGSRITLRGLRDTGNTLRDPVSGERVLVIGAEAAERLTGLNLAQLRDPMDTLAKSGQKGLRLIPYQVIGTKRSFLLAKRFANVKIAGRKKSQLIAFAPFGLDGMDVQALTGGTV